MPRRRRKVEIIKSAAHYKFTPKRLESVAPMAQLNATKCDAGGVRGGG